MIDYSRQLDMIDPELYNITGKPISIVGAGATGSWVATLLAKLGFRNIDIYDFDIVEEHNIPNQNFSIDDVGKKKVDALANALSVQTGIDINPYDRRVGMVGLPTEGIVFLLTDTMNSRKTIAEMLLQKQEVELLIETRMGLDEGQIYTTIPQHEDEVTQYLETLNYTDEQASTSVCGISQSVVTTAVIVASMAVRQAIKFINADEFSRQLHIGIGLDSIVGL